MLPQVHGNFVPGTTRTLEDRPLVNTRTLNDVDECLRVIWNIADALHHAQPGVMPTTEEARGLSCEVGSQVSDHSSLPHVRPRKGSVSPRPHFFRFEHTHSGEAGVEFLLMRESSKRRKTRSSPIYPLSRCRSSLIEKEAMALVKGMTAGACVPNSGMYPCFRWLSYSDGFVSCKISGAITSPEMRPRQNKQAAPGISVVTRA